MTALGSPTLIGPTTNAISPRQGEWDQKQPQATHGLEPWKNGSARRSPMADGTDIERLPRDFGGTTSLAELREMIGHFYNADRGKTAFNSLRALLDLIERLRAQAPAASELEAAHRQGYVRGLVDEAARHAWRGMESAPKDGSSFLACSGRWITVGFWHRAQQCWACSAPQYSRYPSDELPTHWQPLPEPPAEGGMCSPASGLGSSASDRSAP